MKRLLIALLVFLPFQVNASGLQASFTGSNLSLARATTRCEYDGTIDPATGNLVDKIYARNLAPSNSPTSVTSTLQDSSGRRYIARNFVSGSSQTYSLAHAAWMNMFTSNFTLTMIIAPSASGAGTDDLFDKLSGNDGVWMAINASNQVRIRMYNGTDYTEVSNTAVTVRDGYYHVVQIVRSGNYVTIYVDGTPGTVTTVRTADGSNNAGTLYLWGAGGAYYDGTGLYFRLDAEALSLDRLNYERNQLLGIGPRSGTADASYTFSRSSTASQTHSDGTISYVAANIPRIGGSGGGALVEAQATNLLTYSQTQSNAAWGTTNITNPPVAYTGVDPAGTTTGYVLAEDGTAGAEHKIARSAWVTVTASTSYTFSVWLKAINRTWAALMIYENGGTSYYAFFDIANGKVGTTSGSPITKVEQFANGWFRCSVAHATGGGITQVDTAIYIGEADNDWTFNGASQSSIAVFGAQLETNLYASSYIPTTSASVTRSADYLTIRPNKIGKGLLTGYEKMWFDFTQDPAGHTNLCKGSQDFSNAVYWAKSGITVGDSVLSAPDGTTTADSFIEDGTNAVHQNFSDAIAVTSGTVYTASVFLKYNSAAASPRSWAKLTLSDQFGGQTYGFFNIQTGEVGTTKGTDTTLYIKNIGNGWFRCAITGTADSTGNAALGINIATTDGTTTYTGSNLQVSLYAWGAQAEASSTPTGYVATTTTTRTAVSSNEGLFSFDKSGTINRNFEYAKGEYYQTFNGTDSQYVATDSAGAFRPAGNFSVVLVARPDALPTAGNFMYMLGKYTTTGDKRSWAVYYNDGGDYTFAVSQSGTSGTTSFVQKTDGVQVGRIAFIVATFECSDYPTCTPGNTHTAKIYVDDTTVSTDSAFYGPPASNDANMNIGRSGGGSRFQGELYYAAYIDGVVLSPTQVSALYTQYKQANILPIGLGTGYVGQNLTIEFDAKCNFVSSTDMGADRTLLTIGSFYYTGTAPGGSTSTRNYINIFAESSDGKVYADFYSGSSTTRRYMYSAAITTYNQWHKYKVFYDFSNLASSNIWVDGSAGTLDASMTAAAHSFNITDTFIKIGQPNNTAVTGNTPYGTPDGNCAIKNLRIVPARF